MKELVRFTVILCAVGAIVSQSDKCAKSKKNEVFRGPCRTCRDDSDLVRADCGSKRTGDIVIGGLFPIRNNKNECCGEKLRDWAFEDAEAMRFAIDRINDNETLLPGVVLGYEIRDTCSLVQSAQRQTLEFIYNDYESENALLGVVGATYSYNSISVNNLLSLFSVPMISYASTSPKLSDTKEHPYFFRTIPSDAFQARAIAALFKQFNWTYAHGIYSLDAYGVAGFEILEEELERLNIEMGFKAGFEIKASYDKVAKELAVLRTDAANKSLDKWTPAYENGSVIVLFAQLDLVKTILYVIHSTPELQNRNFTFIGCDAWGDKVAAVHFKPHGEEETVNVTDTAKGFLAVNPTRNDVPQFNKYMAELKPDSYVTSDHCNQTNWFDRYWSSKSEENSLAGQVFDSKVHYVIDAVDALAHSLHVYLEKSCSKKTGFCFQQQVNVCKSDIEQCRQNLTDILQNITFQSTTGESFSFDKNGDSTSGHYDIINLKTKPKGELDFDIVGNWDSGAMTLRRKIIWHDGTTTVPSSDCSLPCGEGIRREPILLPSTSVTTTKYSTKCWKCVGKCETGKFLDTSTNPYGECKNCPENQTSNELGTSCRNLKETYLGWSDARGTFLVLLAIVGMILCILTLSTFLHKWNTPIVKATSRELNVTILLGIFLTHLLTFTAVSKPTEALCGILRYFAGVFLSMIFGALLIKNIRILRLFHRKPGMTRPSCIGQESQLLLTGAIVAVSCLISGFWLLLHAPEVIRETQKFDGTASLTCNIYNLGLLAPWLYNLFLIAACVVLANKMRRIPKGFKDTRFINLAAYAEFITWLAFVPIIIAAHNEATLIFSLCLNVTVLGAWGCLFSPKLFILFCRPEKNTKENVATFKPERSSGSRELDSVSPKSRASDTSRLGEETV
ncbi:metabotropic glutamate receptor 7-like [Oscarella lobularis]|uniref:metabotropic glutamate receptor 7-like n=1 Tax=Oscarella lobularis TaxID=121494 RepID=UPI0033138C45